MNGFMRNRIGLRGLEAPIREALPGKGFVAGALRAWDLMLSEAMGGGLRVCPMSVRLFETNVTKAITEDAVLYC
jgi:hypothetical protein